MAIPELELAAKGRPRAPYGCLAVLAATTGLTAWGFLTLRNTTRQLLDAEERLHATILVCGVVGEYLKANGYSAWPDSWDELEKTVVLEKRPYSWPRDAKLVEARVVVDFGARLADVQRQDAGTFRAIRPNGPSATTYIDVGVGPLLADVREHRGAERLNDAAPRK